MSTGSNEYITLAGGLTLPTRVWLLALDLEARGVRMVVDGDDLVVRPRSRLTPDDIAAVKRWKLHLRALLEYEPPAPGWVQ